MITARDLGALAADRLYQARTQLGHLLRRRAADRYRGGDREPVLLLPGVYETWHFLRPVANRLHALGHPIHVLTDLGYNRMTIADSAALAQRYLDDRDLRRVIIIAHSKGGLIAKHMMMIDDVTGRIDRLIAVNSPFDGSKLARYAPVATLRAFSPTDTTVKTLAENLETNSRITSLYSRLDPLIPGGSRLDGATNVELSMVGHFRPLGSRELLDEIERVLASPEAKE
ncbi:MAG TPA: alpha/beta hydrolase [Microbacteriaceae bacterium]|jgi:pimeloyl-ACP methyl ester carboxylesterase|nr:alpha/beta hydrolase [Microbacteriaceae bacterium]